MPPGDRLGLGLTAEHGTFVVINNVHAAGGELLHICVDMRFLTPPFPVRVTLPLPFTWQAQRTRGCIRAPFFCGGLATLNALSF